MNILFRKIVLLALIGTASLAHAASTPPPGDALSKGLWWLYQLQYDKAIESYDVYIAQHPDDAAGYFYKAAAHWWHLAQAIEYPLSDVETQFNENIDLAIQHADEELGRLNCKDAAQKKRAAEVYLFKGGAEGLRGRWLVTQTSWVKAYFAGRSGDNDLHHALKLNPELYDAYLGVGIYDYFSDTLSGFMGAMSAIFVRGDRKRGIEEIKLAIDKSPRARIEASVFLAEIYTFEENTPQKAIDVLKMPRQELPDSPLIYLMEITAYYQMKDWATVEREAHEYLQKSEGEIPWYTKSGILPALYCIGVAELWGKRDTESALKRFNRIMEEAGPTDASRWVSFSLLRRGQIHDLRGERKDAIDDYNAVITRQEIWGSHREAKDYLKTPFTWPVTK